MPEAAKRKLERAAGGKLSVKELAALYDLHPETLLMHTTNTALVDRALSAELERRSCA